MLLELRYLNWPSFFSRLKGPHFIHWQLNFNSITESKDGMLIQQCYSFMSRIIIAKHNFAFQCNFSLSFQTRQRIKHWYKNIMCSFFQKTNMMIQGGIASFGGKNRWVEFAISEEGICNTSHDVESQWGWKWKDTQRFSFYYIGTYLVQMLLVGC